MKNIWYARIDLPNVIKKIFFLKNGALSNDVVNLQRIGIINR